MKAIVLSMVVAMLTCTASAQNVGINKSSPQYPLDVTGDVNVTGDIRINGNKGTAGQVLMVNNAGATAWVDYSEFKNLQAFTNSTGTFTVPAGVTRVMIEAWGGGGGGSSGGGGSAGMYVVSLRNVSPGNLLSITVGQGGNKAPVFGVSATNGTPSSVFGSFGLITALSGRGAFATTPSFATSSGGNNLPYYQYPGQAGDANTVTYAQKNSTTYVMIRKFGDGGAAGPHYNRRSQGQTVVYNESTGSVIEFNSPTLAPFPGGGGGGGGTSVSGYGKDGGDGMVIIRY